VSETPENNDVVGRALALLDHLLDLAHDRILRPIILIGRFVAYGFILLLLSLLVLTALLIGLVRLLDVYAVGGHAWLTYLILSGVFNVVGLVIWRWRKPASLRS
jgi:hypothetical protein